MQHSSVLKLRPSKKDRFYIITCMLNKAPVGVELLNEPELLHDGQKMFDVPNVSIRGFQHFNLEKRPVFKHKRRLGRKPLDFEEVGGFWMLSEAGKLVIEQTCSNAVEFLSAELTFDDGSETKEMWLCDVTLILDALNEETSNVKILRFGEKIYSITSPRPGDYDFYGEVIGSNNLFRMEYALRTVVCSDRLKDEFKANRLKGAMFFEVGHRSN